MDITRIERKLKREKDRQREAARKAQSLGAQLSIAKRSQDTHRKVLAGVWALDQAEKSESFQAGMLRDLDRFWLYLDKDRAAFGLAPLPADEQARRKELVRRHREMKEAAFAATDTAESSGDLPQEREHEAAPRDAESSAPRQTEAA